MFVSAAASLIEELQNVKGVVGLYVDGKRLPKLSDKEKREECLVVMMYGTLLFLLYFASAFFCVCLFMEIKNEFLSLKRFKNDFFANRLKIIFLSLN